MSGSRSHFSPVGISHQTRDSGDQRTAAVLVYLAEILGGSGATSVLGQALQYDTQQAIYTSAQYKPTALDLSTFSLVAVPAPGVDSTANRRRRRGHDCKFYDPWHRS